MLYIGGTWRLGSGKEFSSTNPSDGSILWTGCEATRGDIDEAVQAAREALWQWRRLSIEERAEFLFAFRDQLEQHCESLTKTISDETGKTRWDARSEVQSMIAKIDVSLLALRERRSSRQIELAGSRGVTRYKPHGVMAVFGPFNFPGHIANGHIVPALAAGNTIIFKPSELTPRVTEATVKLWEGAGLPAGVIQLVQGGKETGEALASHDGVNGVLFTGSLRVGIALRHALASRPEKILALELGGNNPLIVHHPDDVDAAVYWTIQSAYLTSGQRCTCARRLIITPGQNRFLDRLVDTIRRIQVGPPGIEPEPFMGPVIHEAAAKHVLDEQQRLRDAGAQILVAAEQLPKGPAFVSPGLLDVTECSARDDCEIFGPLLQLVRVSDFQTAIEEANKTQYGLIAALFGGSREEFETFYDRVEAGLINWNQPTTGASGQLPFGGVKRSGNNRPAGYFTIDFCNAPVASLEAERLTLPETLSPGISFE